MSFFKKKSVRPVSRVPRIISSSTAKNRLDFIKKRILLRLLGLVGFVILLCLFSIWARLQVLGLGYDINTLKQRQDALEEDHKRLRLELSILKSPVRLEKIFGESARLTLPNQTQIIKVTL